MKRFLTLVTLLAVSLAAGAQNFEGTFTQAKKLLTGREIKSEGTITFTAPDQLAMLYTKPDGDYFIIDGPFIRMDMRGIAMDVDTNGNKLVRSQRNAILFSITGQYEDIAKDMNASCNVTKTSNGKHVSIKTKDAVPKGYTGLELDYKANGQLQKMVLIEVGGIATTYVLSIK